MGGVGCFFFFVPPGTFDLWDSCGFPRELSNIVSQDKYAREFSKVCFEEIFPRDVQKLYRRYLQVSCFKRVPQTDVAGLVPKRELQTNLLRYIFQEIFPRLKGVTGKSVPRHRKRDVQGSYPQDISKRGFKIVSQQGFPREISNLFSKIP